MLDQDTKRRIDSCRDILVGKVPDPKSQVEQITIALIYKFMDDMDKESIEMGGKASFFTGEYEKYSWTAIFDPRIGGHELTRLYGEAIEKMNQNPNIPQLFRDIFKNAYLPYRDPETLKLFLKEINNFSYSHSEKLGDAFEYLLSFMGTQGDAGQFRTPRHIIDFIAEAVNPQKHETILDPACGTAGFLISAYKHILKENDGGKKLTPTERKRMLMNFSGYDISPDMVRLSLVNLYLHGFQDPKIVEYDTLTSEERWNDSVDVILANPPFMTPKGGIRPHKRFSIQAKRSEVLFVDYIAEHLNPNGRAGVIVPEGIIFQSSNAYKNLRKMLIEDYLWAVVSLPAGVFQPYSGVKTSILLLDKRIAKKSKDILFIKVENDGFDLGAQRRPIDKNDLPEALRLIKNYEFGMTNEEIEEKFIIDNSKFIIVPKSKIEESGDWNLSGERYRDGINIISQHYEMVELDEICELESGSRQKGGALTEGIPSIGGGEISTEGKIKTGKMKYVSQEHFEKMKKGKLEVNDVLIVKDGATTGKTGFYTGNYKQAAVNEHVYILRSKENIKPIYLYSLVRGTIFQNKLKKYIKGIIGGISSEIKQIQIPLPPLSVQEEIVAEIDGYQKIIDGARQVVDNYKPTIKISPDWEMVKVGELCDLVRGSSPRPKSDKRFYGGNVPRLMVSDVTRDGMYTTPSTDFLTEEGAKQSRLMKKNEVVMAVSGNPGLPTILNINAYIHDGFVGYRELSKNLMPEFFYFVLLWMKERNSTQSIGAVFKNLNTTQIRQFKIPLPPLSVQREIVTQIEAEQEMVNANKKLIEIYEQKIKDKIGEVWGEED